MYSSYTCGKCGRPVGKGAARCPHCGVRFAGIRTVTRSVSHTSSTGTSRSCIALAVVGVVIVAVALVFSARSGKKPEPAPSNLREQSQVVTEAAQGDRAAGTDSTRANQSLFEAAKAGAYRGEQVTLMVPGGSSYRPELYDALLRDFERATGIQVTLDASDDFSQVLKVRQHAGDLPDLAVIQDLSLVADLAAAGDLIDPRELFDETELRQRYDPAWLQAAMFPSDGGEIMAGVYYRYRPAHLVFYARDNFEAAGYPLPETWDDLLALSERIVADGGTPWCLGLETFTEYPWIAAFWLEEILLHSQPAAVYQDLLAGELAYDSPQVGASLERLGEVWFREGYVHRSESDSPDPWTYIAAPLFAEPPGCWLYLEGSYITSYFPEEAEYGEDYGWLFIPPTEERYGRSQIVWGTLLVAFDDRPEVGALIDYLARVESAKPWVEDGIDLSPFRNTQLEWYPDDYMRSLAQGMDQISAVMPDALSLMPQSEREQFYDSLTPFISQGLAALAGPPPVERSGHIADLLSEGSISIVARGSGIDDLSLDIENLIEELLDVEIPAGTYFTSGSSGVQNMVVRHAEVVQIEPGELLNILLDVACANMERDVPTGEQRFSVQRQGSSNLAELMPVLESANVSYIVAQAAIWIVTDNANYADLGTLVSGYGQARVIHEEHAAQAMQLVDQAVGDITHYRIWTDREKIATGASNELAVWIRQRAR